ncbi:uncharacterized protein LOC141655475 [Silene latifolia]|uniref:uncharacterized protein LOC141655475 n=1 Tax=Silene latifolia TaxID=37657 RepID=UPI003D77D0FE
MVYASNDARIRDVLWAQLAHIKLSVDKWILLGDFNVVRDVTERISDTPPTLADILDFNNSILHCGLEDLPSTGCGFTWTNKQETGTRVWSKLDKALGNSSWSSMYPATSVNFMASGVSDNSHVVVTVFEDQPKKSMFSYLNCCTEDPHYDSLVQEAWCLPTHCSTTFKLFEKLRNVRKALRSLYGTRFNGITARVLSLSKELENCELELQAQPLSAVLMDKERELLTQYYKFRRIEKNILKQKAKVANIKHNDCSSKFFYVKIQERSQQQIIGHIKDMHGHDRLGLQNVADGFLEYYKSLLGSDKVVKPLDSDFLQQGNCVTPSAFGDLVKPVSSEEIRQGLFAIV